MFLFLHRSNWIFQNFKLVTYTIHSVTNVKICGIFKIDQIKVHIKWIQETRREVRFPMNNRAGPLYTSNNNEVEFKSISFFRSLQNERSLARSFCRDRKRDRCWRYLFVSKVGLVWLTLDIFMKVVFIYNGYELDQTCPLAYIKNRFFKDKVKQMSTHQQLNC